MSQISVIITLVVIVGGGLLLWLVGAYIQTDRKFKSIVKVGAVIWAIDWLLGAFGILSHAGDIDVPRVQ